VLLKPSELCPRVSELFATLTPQYLDADAVKVAVGGREVVSALLEQRWDHIIFTGSERVGRIVAAAAAKHLTPTTLELGGKCPVLLDPNSCEPMASVATKVVFGRFYVTGQSCIAPEYILTPRPWVDELGAEIVKAIAKAHGGDSDTSAHFGRLSTAAAAERVGKLIVGHGGKVLCGGTADPSKRFVAPTVIVDPREDSPIMQEEVFGPVVSLITVDSLDEAIAYVKRRTSACGTPLALYGFSGDDAVQRRLLDEIPSGSALFNDFLIHFANPNIPFGGLGSSGGGALHGRYYFDACRQQRGVMTKGTSIATRLLDAQVMLRAPPYSEKLVSALGVLLLKFPLTLPPHYGVKALLLALACAALAAVRAAGLHLVLLRGAATAVLDWVGPA